MKFKVFALSLIISSFFCLNNALASEITNGYLRLILNEASGRYSLYFLSNPNAVRYEPLFSVDDPTTSYASVLADGKVYRLGGKFFKNKLDKINGVPALVFEGGNITVIQLFTPVKSQNSKYANGVMISYLIRNTGSTESLIGFRILIDTNLSEKIKNTFLTGEQVVKNETLLEGYSGERFWISRGKNTALMGSIINPVDPNLITPDYIHFANWKRLNDAPWKLKYREKRSFNFPPFSVNDSAVCYYYDQTPLLPGNELNYSIVLSTEDVEWYNSLRVPAVSQPVKPAPAPAPVKAAPPTTAPAPAVTARVPEEEKQPVIPGTIDIKQIEMDAYVEAMEKGEDVNAYTLKKYQEILNRFISGEMELNEQDLINLEKAIEWYR